jgi:RNA polymerase sigma-70 factor (ECF subfamily)
MLEEGMAHGSWPTGHVVDAALVQRLHDRARAGRWDVSLERFRTALEASAAWRFRDARPASGAVAQYLEALHVEDLALACACSDGHDEAWRHFVEAFRPALYRVAASVVAGDDARDLADSLYADLFGITERDGVRQSLFRYYHGRSSLPGWLRAVLAQRAVDRARARRQTTGLPDEESLPAPEPRQGLVPDPDRARHAALLGAALMSAVTALDAPDRLRLALYYAQGLTLAETGRILREHEATVSRKLDRTRKALRAATERRLREVDRLATTEIAACFEHAIDDWQADLAGALQGVAAKSFSEGGGVP